MSALTSKVLSVLSTVVLTVCALVVTTLIVRRELASQRPSGPNLVAQPDWEKYTIEGNRLGSPEAKVVVVEFSDFQCPACRQMEGVLRLTRKRFGSDFAIVYRHKPLDQIHTHATAAAIASECAARQGRFEEMHNLLFERQDSIGVISWQDFAVRSGVRDLDDFRACTADPAIAAIIDRDRRAADELGVRGTPTLLVDGLRANGTLSLTVMDSLVTKALERRN